MYLLDHIAVNDFIIASMLADNSKAAQKKLAWADLLTLSDKLEQL